jgi:hypothetical protein
VTYVLTDQIADKFARIALGHVRREFPNKLDHVLESAEDSQRPRRLHPIFFGSFDWHSCVHGHWLLARIYRLFPKDRTAPVIRRLLDHQLTDEKVSGELSYLERPSSAGFERPYGWAWLLALQAELDQHISLEGLQWSAALRPLAQAFADRFRTYLPKLTYPIRSGTHANTAFALRLAADYAEVCQDRALGQLLGSRARDWFGADAGAQAWEPSGDDFLSPTLMEAECLRRLLPPLEFRDWFDRFLPALAEGEPATLFTPAVVSDPSDGKIAHLDGLNLSRAWCFRSLAKACHDGHRRRWMLEEAARRHLDASLPAVAGDYMGEHWLASFALLALEA